MEAVAPRERGRTSPFGTSSRGKSAAERKLRGRLDGKRFGMRGKRMAAKGDTRQVLWNQYGLETPPHPLAQRERH